MKILITGGCGYIGSVLVEQLLQKYSLLKDTQVVVYDNLLYKQESLLSFVSNPQLKFVYGDVRNERYFQKYVGEADYIIPLAAIVGMPACDKDPLLAEAVNFKQLDNIAKWSRNDARIIVPNTNSGYGVGESETFCTEKTPLKPISVYGVTKCKGEQAVLDSGKGISFRLATVFGFSYRFRKDLLVNDFVWKAVTDKYIVLFESHFKRNFIHVRDVVSAIILMIDSFESYRGEVFNVGLSNANLSKLELCERIKERVPAFVIKQDDYAKDFDQRNYIVSNDKLELTGWSPKWSLERGINELIEGYKILTHTLTKHTNL